MALAIAMGIVAGIAGFLPLFAALRLARRSTSTSALTAGLYGLGGTFASLVILVVALILCAVVDLTHILPFGIAEIVSIIVTTSVYVVYKNVLAKKRSIDARQPRSRADRPSQDPRVARTSSSRPAGANGRHSARSGAAAIAGSSSADDEQGAA